MTSRGFSPNRITTTPPTASRSVQVDRATTKIRSQLHLDQIANAYGNAVAESTTVFSISAMASIDVLVRANEASAANDVFHPVGFDRLCTHIDIGIADGTDQPGPG